MTVKTLATGVAALAAIGAAAAGVTCIASVTTTLPQRSAGRFQRATAAGPAGAPAPTCPLPDVIARPPQQPAGPERVVRQQGCNLVQGGIGGVEGHPSPTTNCSKAAAKGSLPLTFNITNIAPGRSGRRVGQYHRDRSAPRSDNREPHVRRPGRLGAVAHLGDDVDPVGAVGGRLTAGWMGRRLTAVLSAATIVAALSLSGCSSNERGASTESEPAPASASATSTAAAHVAPLPPPDDLAKVLYRLADPGGARAVQKLSLVEGATPENAGVLDQFANALLNGGYAPVKVDVRDIGWSDRDPADVVANINVSSPNRGGPRFSFPMEFKPCQAGWQLSARTADVLLALQSRTPSPPPAATPGR